jgi:malonyl-CoA/methylmalonyl-CoA synthetase
VLLDLFDGALADRAGALALDDLTFADVHGGAKRVARRLHERGVRFGDRIAVYCENRHGFVLAYLAALRLGAVAVPVNPLYRASDLAHVLRDARPTAIVRSASVASYLDQAGAGGAAIVDVAEVESWARSSDVRPYDAGQRPQPDDVALIVYTSGTTGKSKGAMLSHGNLAAIAAQVTAAWRWQASDTLFLSLPLFHVHGLIAGLTASLSAGARVVLRERFDARDALDRFARGDVTMFFGVPTMYVRLLESLRDGEPRPPLRLYVSGSAALSAEVHHAFKQRFGASILERYGATEFGFALGNRYGGPRIAGSVGVPFPGVRVRIAAPESVTPLPPGEVGELLVSGPNVFRGYWDRDDATGEAFLIDDDATRWYRSGDLAQYEPARDVYRIVGRIKELIITGGFNVYPREVEDAIEAFPGVRACAVVGKPDAARGELPVAFVETVEALHAEAMLAALRERLASFKVPKEIRFVESLPRNAMGKVDKPALRAALDRHR